MPDGHADDIPSNGPGSSCALLLFSPASHSRWTPGPLGRLVACTRYCVEALPELQSRPLTVVADSWSSTMEEYSAVQPNLVIASVPYRMESLAAILRAGCPV